MSFDMGQHGADEGRLKPYWAFDGHMVMTVLMAGATVVLLGVAVMQHRNAQDEILGNNVTSYLHHVEMMMDIIKESVTADLAKNVDDLRSNFTLQFSFFLQVLSRALTSTTIKMDDHRLHLQTVSKELTETFRDLSRLQTEFRESTEQLLVSVPEHLKDLQRNLVSELEMEEELLSNLWSIANDTWRDILVILDATDKSFNLLADLTLKIPKSITRHVHLLKQRQEEVSSTLDSTSHTLQEVVATITDANAGLTHEIVTMENDIGSDLNKLPSLMNTLKADGQKLSLKKDQQFPAVTSTVDEFCSDMKECKPNTLLNCGG